MADEAVLQKLISIAVDRVLDLVRNIESCHHTMIMLDADEELHTVSVQSDLVEEIETNLGDENTVADYLLSSYASILRLHKATSYAIATPAYLDNPGTGSSDLVVVIGAYTNRESLSGYFPILADGGGRKVAAFVEDPEVEKNFNFRGLLAPVTLH